MILFWNLGATFICCLEGSICHQCEASTPWPLCTRNQVHPVSEAGGLGMNTQTRQLPRDAGADTPRDTGRWDPGSDLRSLSARCRDWMLKASRGLDFRRNELPGNHQDSSDQNQGDGSKRHVKDGGITVPKHPTVCLRFVLGKRSRCWNKTSGQLGIYRTK